MKMYTFQRYCILKQNMDHQQQSAETQSVSSRWVIWKQITKSWPLNWLSRGQKNPHIDRWKTDKLFRAAALCWIHSIIFVVTCIRGEQCRLAALGSPLLSGKRHQPGHSCPSVQTAVPRPRRARQSSCQCPYWRCDYTELWVRNNNSPVKQSLNDEMLM